MKIDWHGMSIAAILLWLIVSFILLCFEATAALAVVVPGGIITILALALFYVVKESISR